MKVNYTGFIGLYKDVYPEGYCQHIIEEFERLLGSGAGSSRIQSENASRHTKDDMQLELNIGVHTVSAFEQESSTRIFFDGLQRCYNKYTENFSVLKNGNIRASAMKMQRTNPGGGYHVWHAEQGNGDHAERVLVYMLYLNNLHDGEGGETEFLYQKLRVKPEENTMVIWPASYTHVHRGNTVLGDRSKYIITGWFYYD